MSVDLPGAAFLEVRDLYVHFPTDDGLVKSVDGVSFELGRGRTLGIVGESGSGKSTLGRMLLGIDPAQGGEVRFDANGRHRATVDRNGNQTDGVGGYREL